MEKQTVTVTIRTSGDKCMMTDGEILAWYKEQIASLFNPAYGTPEIEVRLERTETGD